MTRTGYLALVLTCSAMFRGHASGDGVAGVLEAKTLSEDTSELTVGDIVLFRFRMVPVPDKAVHGIQGYLTDYIPANAQVVGLRIVDGDGVTVEPAYPGLAGNDCGRPCNGFDSVPGNGGMRNLDDGSIAQLHADTGLFYTTDLRLIRNPAASFITLANGIVMSPPPTSVGSVAANLGAAAPFHSHNDWDWTQVRAYGISNAGGNASGNNGLGNTPYLYGSPVAGPDTWYRFEASRTGASVEFNDVVGPWLRIAYPGSQIGTGAPVAGPGTLRRMNVPTSAGADVTPLNPLPVGTTAVRLALGEIRGGEKRYAEVALRVLGTPLDPVQGQDVNCAESHGADASAASARMRGKDNMWGLYLASPACVLLNLLYDLTVDRPLATVGDTVNYTLHGKNRSVEPQSAVVRRLRYDSTRVAFVAATGSPIHLGTCDDGSGVACLVWPTVTLLPSDEFAFTATFTVRGGGHGTATALANYTSDQLPMPGFTTQATVLVKELAVVDATLSAPLEGGAAGGTIAFTGTIGNTGSGAGSFDTLTVVLPDGWRMSGPLTLAGTTLACSSGCATNAPTYNVSSSLASGASRPLAFSALVPADAATGLYTVDLQVWASQTAFGGAFETYLPKLTKVSVGRRRSDAPVVTCPIIQDATTIGGTSTEADGTAVRVFFNLLQRCSAIVSGGTWTCAGFADTFGQLYGGLEVRAAAEAPGELEGPLSVPCVVSN